MIMGVKDKMKRLKDEPRLVKFLIMKLCREIEKYKRDTWYRFGGSLKIDGEEYEYDVECKRDEMMFSYKNMHLSRPTEIIDVDEMVRNGTLQ